MEQRLPEERRSGKNPPEDRIQNVLTHDTHTRVKSGAHTHTHLSHQANAKALRCWVTEVGVVATAANRTMLRGDFRSDWRLVSAPPLG